MKVAPEARVDDGLLDVVFVKKAFKPRLLPLLAKVYSGSPRGPSRDRHDPAHRS